MSPADAFGLVDRARAIGWLWPPLASLVVIGLALWQVLQAQRFRTIFVSYRRSDTATQTTQIVAQLAARFRKGGVFHDVVSIAPGTNFRLAIAQTLHRCDAAL